MSLVPCSLPHAVCLVVPRQQFAAAAAEYAGLLPASAEQLVADLKALAETGVPTWLGEDREGKPLVTFCTPRYELFCGLSSQGDAYYAYRLSPLSLRSHHQLARGAVGLAPGDWQIYPDVASLNRPGHGRPAEGGTGLAALQAAWKKTLEVDEIPLPPGEALPAARQNFLAGVERLIDLARRLELDRAARQQRLPVTGVEVLPSPRPAAGLYRFRLGVPAALRAREYLWAGPGGPTNAQSPGYLGMVEEVAGRSLTVRFSQAIDPAPLKKVEWVLPWVSTRQYAIQLEALQALREGRSLNEHLLPVIVEGNYQPYTPATLRHIPPEINPAQRSMIERALRVPDMLLVLGPPGTGKTRTIQEIVLQQARRGKRVLVTSRNNTAVDNVLEKLEGVEALRIGREEAVSDKVRPLMIDERACQMQQDVLARVQPDLEALESLQQLWPQVLELLEQLNRLAADWRGEQVRQEQAARVLHTWQRSAYRRIEPSLERQRQRFAEEGARLRHLVARSEALRRRLERARRYARLPLLGPLFTLWAAQLYASWEADSQECHVLLRKLANAKAAIHQVWDAYRRHAAASEEALQLKRPLAEAEQAVAAVRQRIAAVLDSLAERLWPFAGVPLPDTFASPQALEALQPALQEWYEALMRRHALLGDWSDLLRTRPQALYPTILQSAQVVGATCIGIATDARFEDMEFDLVIADEAGQIQVMDLLVPLVRARRAILVGDHQQLPPLVEEELLDRLGPDERFLRPWLEKSLFEILFERQEAPETHTIMLDTQYRMPRLIADFISGQFYQGRYRTGSEAAASDPFFATSLVFVDTVKEGGRFEQASRDEPGYTNRLEASLVADLLAAYQARGLQADSIVPYKKQAEAIRAELRRQAAFADENLANRVATVDSFQGQEREVIVFSFTRSNARERVGFLVELRRLNVCLTRAKRQLIVIGDSGTLRNASDEPFARLIQALLESVQHTPGGYLHAGEVRQLLKR